jgi:hypothetical protein
MPKKSEMRVWILRDKGVIGMFFWLDKPKKLKIGFCTPTWNGAKLCNPFVRSGECAEFVIKRVGRKK